MVLKEEKEHNDRSPTDGQIAVLETFSWFSLALNSVVLILAIHNLVRYNKKIGQARNNALILSFYICTIVQACLIISKDAAFSSS